MHIFISEFCNLCYSGWKIIPRFSKSLELSILTDLAFDIVFREFAFFGLKDQNMLELMLLYLDF